MFAHAIEVGGDRAGADVHVGAEVGVAEVAQVVGLHAGGQAAVLHLHEVADAAIFAEYGLGAQLGEGTDQAAAGHLGIADHRVEHLHILGDFTVFDQAAGAEAAAVADHVCAAEMALGIHDHIAAEAGAIAEGAAGRIGEGDPLAHPVLAQPLLQAPFAGGELEAIVDAVDFVAVGHLQVGGVAEQGDGVGEVELALVVVGGELGENGGEASPVEAVDAGVGEGVGPLLGRAIAVFDDGADAALAIGEHAAVAGWIGEAGGEQGDGGAALTVLGQELREGFGAEQGHIAVQYQQLACEAM